MNPLPTLLEVKSVGEQKLFVRFSDGVAGEVFLAIPTESFLWKKFADAQYFSGCRVAHSGHAIQRDDDVDIDATAQWIALTGKNPFLVT